MNTTADWEEPIRRLERLMRLRSFPVAFKLLEDKSALSESVSVKPPAAKPPVSNKAVAEATLSGKHIGQYEILKRIGSGGMGIVYLATRRDKQFRQKVAIKVLKRGMDSEEILKRFRSEHQILASLDHPNIANLIDGGITDDEQCRVVGADPVAVEGDQFVAGQRGDGLGGAAAGERRAVGVVRAADQGGQRAQGELHGIVLFLLDFGQPAFPEPFQFLGGKGRVSHHVGEQVE